MTFSVFKHVPVFRNRMFADEFLENLRFYCAKDKCFMYGFVIMPHHVHLLLEMTGEKTVSDVIRDVKKYFSYRVRNVLCHKSRFDFSVFMRANSFQFWERGFDEVTIVTERMFQVKLRYIHYNPVKAGLVENVKDYHYSSAKEYGRTRDGGGSEDPPITVLRAGSGKVWYQ